MVATPAAHVASAPDCTPAHLKVSLGPSDGAAGTIYYTILFRNTGTAACALRGYPGVSSVGGADAHQIGAPARRQPVAHLHSTVLAAGAYGSATYGQTQALNYPKARCRPASARGIRVYAPNVLTAVILPLKHLACASTTAHDSVIGPVAAGRKGSTASA
jgi:hypothetical protein